ncbi:MAG: FecR family protein [Elusimicrobiota bacterium]
MGMKKGSLLMKSFICISIVALSLSLVSAAVIRKVAVESLRGQVETSLAGTEIWKACKTGAILNETAKIRTGDKSFVVLKMDDGTKVRLAANTIFSIKTMKPEVREFELNRGNMRAWVKKLTKNESFATRTPTAVCAVRGTEFEIEVDENNKTRVSLLSGLVAVRHVNGLGEEIVVHPNERIDVLPDLMPSAPEPISAGGSGSRGALALNSSGKDEMATEVGMDMSREQVQAAAAQEMKMAEYQQGKSLIDVFGKRVRVEEYIIRPQEDTMKLVTMNERDNRFDYFVWKVQFDKAIPTDLTASTKWIGWTEGSVSPDYYVKTNEWNASNTVDKVESQYSGGHVENSGGTYKLLFNNYYYRINNIDKMTYAPTTSGANITSMNDVTWKVAGGASAGMTNTAFETWFGANTESTVSADKLNDSLKVTFADNTWSKEEYYIINDEGKVGARSVFSGLAGNSYRDQLLKWNQQLVMTSSEFTGVDKKIDLVVEPKLFVDAGLVAIP